MKNLVKLFLIVSSFGFIVAGPAVQASEFDKKTIVSFSNEMEIPGMVLPAGKYVMKRVSPSLPDVVQFSNANENHIYAMVFALPTYRQVPTGDVVIITEERRAGEPEAIKKWFYPGDIVGAEFVYPKSSSRLMASTSTTLSSSANPPAKVAEPAPAIAETERPAAAVTPALASESPEPVEIAQATPPQTTPEPATLPAQTNPTEQAEPMQRDTQEEPITTEEELPRTASNLAMFGLIGCLLLIGGFSFRRLAYHLS